mgnify:CR=1 FL=1
MRHSADCVLEGWSGCTQFINLIQTTLTLMENTFTVAVHAYREALIH